MVSDLNAEQRQRNAAIAQFWDTWRKATDEWKQSPEGKEYEQNHHNSDELACSAMREKGEKINKIDGDIAMLEGWLRRKGRNSSTVKISS